MNKLLSDNSPLIISVGTTIYVCNQVGEKNNKNNNKKTVATYQYKGKIRKNIYHITLLFNILGKVTRKQQTQISMKYPLISHTSTLLGLPE